MTSTPPNIWMINAPYLTLDLTSYVLWWTVVFLADKSKSGSRVHRVSCCTGNEPLSDSGPLLHPHTAASHNVPPQHGWRPPPAGARLPEGRPGRPPGAAGLVSYLPLETAAHLCTRAHGTWSKHVSWLRGDYYLGPDLCVLSLPRISYRVQRPLQKNMQEKGAQLRGGTALYLFN